MSGDFDRDFDDAESLESDLDLLDLLLSTLFDRDFFERDSDLDRDFLDLGDFDFDLLVLERSRDLDFDLLDLDLDLLDRDLERDRLDLDAGDRDLRDFETGDLDRDFFERFVGDFECDFFEILSGSSGDGERLFFFLPSAMLINFACKRDMATAASGFVLMGINGMAFSGWGESSRTTLTSGISFPLSFDKDLLGDLEPDLRLRPMRSRSL